ncbi:MAG: DMT family transporter [Alphaproteobacteria bacterium]|nr:DMT family transporter [Alphaproteobacteria bacterium]
MTKNFNGYLFALFAIFLWSFNVIYSKYLANTFTPFEISFVRWIIPALLFLPFTYKSIIINRHIFLKHWPLILILTLTGLGFQNTFVYYAGHTANAVDMALINATSPIFLIIFSAIFLHSKINFLQIIGILTAIFGVILVILDGDLSNFNNISLTAGDLWMLLSAILFAIYGVAQKLLPPDVPAQPAFSLMICISAIMFLPLAAYDYSHHLPEKITKPDILILLILGVFNSGLAYFIWNKAIALIGTVKTGTIYYLIPVFSTIEAYFLLNEEIYKNQIYGALLVILGIVLSNYKRSQTPPPTQKKRG